ncbi:nitroreductase family protein [Paenibacillus sp. UMB4589-SE434]|uniref:nitroreductase family protein n=1 Tax=Paenibacillus sp. UMB4589-SE434 TaxID=3046314 RepID=UPI00254E4CD4|nr:nitroreductase family protein [Paenibacillus sp. UMB4589-SE434]MDK8179545.1 nitroreductase family protein [Paenibacillus sp. UMB4589-SE434]
MDQYKSVVSNVIRERRTIRSYKSEPLSSDRIEALLAAAAVSCEKEFGELPCRFLLATSEEGKRKAGEAVMSIYTEQKLYKWVPNKVSQFMISRIVKIPALLAVITRRDVDVQQRERNEAAVSSLLHTFSLLAWEQRIGMVWGTDEMLQHPSLKKGLGLQEEEQLHCLCYVGAYDKVPKAKPRIAANQKFTLLTERDELTNDNDPVYDTRLATDSRLYGAACSARADYGDFR